MEKLILFLDHVLDSYLLDIVEKLRMSEAWILRFQNRNFLYFKSRGTEKYELFSQGTHNFTPKSLVPIIQIHSFKTRNMLPSFRPCHTLAYSPNVWITYCIFQIRTTFLRINCCFFWLQGYLSCFICVHCCLHLTHNSSASNTLSVRTPSMPTYENV